MIVIIIIKNLNFLIEEVFFITLKFAYWAPNVSGGLVISKLPQKTGWDFEDNVRYAQIAENLGFDYVLLQTRFFASYGAELQLEAATLSAALAARTEKLQIITAVLPGLWHPGVMAKMLATIDHVSAGRSAVNIVSGWFKGEFIGYGEPWLDHDERYRRSEEFIRVLRELWTAEYANFKGDFYSLNDAQHKPKPIRPPKIFQGGNSHAAKAMAGRVSDVYFMNGNTLENIQKQIDEVRALREEAGQGPIEFGVNGFVIVRETEEEAWAAAEKLIEHVDDETIAKAQEVFKRMDSEGQRLMTSLHEGDHNRLLEVSPNLWAGVGLVRTGAGTALVGDPDTVAARIKEYQVLGIDKFILSGYPYLEEAYTTAELLFPKLPIAKKDDTLG